MPGLFGGGETKSTTVLQIPAASAAETQQQQAVAELSSLQLDEFKRAQAEREAQAASPLTAAQGRLEQLATDQLLARLEGRAPVLTPEAQQRIGTAYDLAQRRGGEAIKKSATEAAQMRGMTIADSPMAAEYLRQQRELTEGLGAARATSELDVGQTEANFAQSLAAFQNQLKQQAFMNRMALATGNVSPASGALMQNLFGQRMAAAPQSQTIRNPMNWAQGLTGLGQFAGGTGGLARGLSGYFGGGSGLSGGAEFGGLDWGTASMAGGATY